jgi:PAS domain S-box-containing protein
MKSSRHVVFEASRDVLLIVRAEDGRILDVNPAALATYGYTRDELLSLTIFDLRVESPPEIAHQLALADREGALFETLHRRSDGSLFPVEVSSQGSTVNGARVLVSIIRDVTGRKQVEEALRQREWRYRTIFENAGIGIGEADPAGRMTMVNERLCEILGRPQQDIIGRVGRDFIHPEDRIAADRLHTDMLEGRIDAFETELRYVRPDGRAIWTRIRATCRRDPETGLPQRIAVIEDISARKDAERVLNAYKESLEIKVKERTRQLEEAVARLEELLVERTEAQALLRRLSGVFLNAADPIIIEDLQGVILEVNREAERAYGWTRDQLVGHPITRLFPPDRHAWTADVISACRRGEEVPNIESVRQDRGGRPIPVLTTAFPLKDDEGRVTAIATIAKDISQRKQMEQRLRESQESLQALSRKTIDALEADRRTVSRELHDSIGANLAALKFMLEEAEIGSPGQLRRGITLLRDTIKEVKRVSANLRPLTIDDLGLIKTIQGHVQQFQSQFGIKCECRIGLAEEDLPDALKIVVYRVMQEALANTGKHSRATHANVRLERDRTRMILTVSDNGCGFDPSTPRRPDPLSGYGIRSMRERVEICRGDFDITSTPGRGTRLQASFPLGLSGACTL